MRKICKALTFFVLFSFTVNSISFGLPLSLGKREARFLPSKLNAFKIPSLFGKVEKIRNAKSERIIIHISDVHTSKAVQQNVAGIINYLRNTFGVSLVLSEGVVGEVDTSLLRNYPDAKIKRKVSERLLSEGKINGVEFLSINSSKDLKILGVEDRKLYIENLKTYQSIAQLRDRVKPFIYESLRKLDKVRNSVYPEELIKLEDLKQDCGQKPSKLKDYVLFLNNQYLYFKGKRVDAEKYPNFTAFLRLLRMDADVSKKEREREIAALQAGVDVELFGEMEHLADRVARWLFITKTQKKLYETRQALRLVRKALTLELTREEVKKLAELKGVLSAKNLRRFLGKSYSRKGARAKEFNEAVKAVFDFYRIASRRDIVLAGNALSRLRESGNNVAILFTGGYHNSGIRNYLRKENVSFIGIRPKIPSGISPHRYFSNLENLSIKSAMSKPTYFDTEPVVTKEAMSAFLHDMTVMINEYGGRVGKADMQKINSANSLGKKAAVNMKKVLKALNIANRRRLISADGIDFSSLKGDVYSSIDQDTTAKKDTAAGKRKRKSELNLLKELKRRVDDGSLRGPFLINAAALIDNRSKATLSDKGILIIGPEGSGRTVTAVKTVEKSGKKRSKHNIEIAKNGQMFFFSYADKMITGAFEGEGRAVEKKIYDLDTYEPVFDGDEVMKKDTGLVERNEFVSIGTLVYFDQKRAHKKIRVDSDGERDVASRFLAKEIDSRKVRNLIKEAVENVDSVGIVRLPSRKGKVRNYDIVVRWIKTGSTEDRSKTARQEKKMPFGLFFKNTMEKIAVNLKRADSVRARKPELNIVKSLIEEALRVLDEGDIDQAIYLWAKSIYEFEELKRSMNERMREIRNIKRKGFHEDAEWKELDEKLERLTNKSYLGGYNELSEKIDESIRKYIFENGLSWKENSKSVGERVGILRCEGKVDSFKEIKRGESAIDRVYDIQACGDYSDDKIAKGGGGLLVGRLDGDAFHNTVLCAECRAPFATFPMIRSYLRDFEGEWVYFRVSEESSQIRLAKPKEIDRKAAYLPRVSNLRELSPYPKPVLDGAYAFKLDKTNNFFVNRIGTKAAGLALLHKMFPQNVPDAILVTHAAFHAFLKHNRLDEVMKIILTSKRSIAEKAELTGNLIRAHRGVKKQSEAIRDVVLLINDSIDPADEEDMRYKNALIKYLSEKEKSGFDLPDEVKDAIEALYKDVIDKSPCIIRSSCTFEDLLEMTAAGVYYSSSGRVRSMYEVLLEVRKVWASNWGRKALENKAYYEQQDWCSRERDEFQEWNYKEGRLETYPAVIIQEYVSEVEFSCTVHTAKPLANTMPVFNEVHIELTRGGGPGMAEERGEPAKYIYDTYTKELSVERELSGKRIAIEYKEELGRGRSTKGLVDPEIANEPVIKKAEYEFLVQVAENCKKIEKAFGRPQEIELIVTRKSDGTLRMIPVQSRPMAGLDIDKSDFTAAKLVYENLGDVPEDTLARLLEAEMGRDIEKYSLLISMLNMLPTETALAAREVVYSGLRNVVMRLEKDDEGPLEVLKRLCEKGGTLDAELGGFYRQFKYGMDLLQIQERLLELGYLPENAKDTFIEACGSVRGTHWTRAESAIFLIKLGRYDLAKQYVKFIAQEAVDHITREKLVKQLRKRRMAATNEEERLKLENLISFFAADIVPCIREICLDSIESICVLQETLDVIKARYKEVSERRSKKVDIKLEKGPDEKLARENDGENLNQRIRRHGLEGVIVGNLWNLYTKFGYLTRNIQDILTCIKSVLEEGGLKNILEIFDKEIAREMDDGTSAGILTKLVEKNRDSGNVVGILQETIIQMCEKRIEDLENEDEDRTEKIEKIRGIMEETRQKTIMRELSDLDAEMETTTTAQTALRHASSEIMDRITELMRKKSEEQNAKSLGDETIFMSGLEIDRLESIFKDLELGVEEKAAVMSKMLHMFRGLSGQVSLTSRNRIRMIIKDTLLPENFTELTEFLDEDRKLVVGVSARTIEEARDIFLKRHDLSGIPEHIEILSLRNVQDEWRVLSSRIKEAFLDENCWMENIAVVGDEKETLKRLPGNVNRVLFRGKLPKDLIWRLAFDIAANGGITPTSKSFALKKNGLIYLNTLEELVHEIARKAKNRKIRESAA